MRTNGALNTSILIALYLFIHLFLSTSTIYIYIYIYLYILVFILYDILFYGFSQMIHKNSQSTMYEYLYYGNKQYQVSSLFCIMKAAVKHYSLLHLHLHLHNNSTK